MGLSSLAVRSFRNLASVDISHLSADLNLIFGVNASGKTSLLEAIYFLARGRSFRSAHFERLLQNGHDTLSVFGKLRTERGLVPLGIERSTQKTSMRMDGRAVSSAAELAAAMPLLVLQPNSYRLLEEGPANRRRFVDWGVFHVEPLFYPAWQRYQRALRQRNTALRAGEPVATFSAWDHEIIDAGNIIDTTRRAYVEQLAARINVFTDALLNIHDVTLEYRSGWSAEQTFETALSRGRDRDQAQRYTVAGPHRAELWVRSSGSPVVERISRGQNKILVAALTLAQASLFSEQTGKDCILLVDDLAAELDAAHRYRLLEMLAELRAQLFVTVIEPDSVADALERPARRFHVEHGSVREVV